MEEQKAHLNNTLTRNGMTHIVSEVEREKDNKVTIKRIEYTF